MKQVLNQTQHNITINIIIQQEPQMLLKPRNKQPKPSDFENTSTADDYVVTWQWNGKDPTSGQSGPLTREEAERVLRARRNEDHRFSAQIRRRP